jgi:C1A family cysteine protease
MWIAKEAIHNMYRRKFYNCLGSLAIVVQFSGLLVAQFQPSASLSQVYAKREQEASTSVKDRLAMLRRTIQEKDLSFEVTYTQALDVSLEKLAGLRLPLGFSELAHRHNESIRNLVLKTPPPSSGTPNVCSVSASAFSWRDAGKVTAVQDQGNCGSCWAFSAIASYESSYMIRNSDRPDASEQHALNCSNAGSCDGGWYGPVFEWMINCRLRRCEGRLQQQSSTFL